MIMNIIISSNNEIPQDDGNFGKRMIKKKGQGFLKHVFYI